MYVGDDRNLHFVNSAGADTVLNFSMNYEDAVLLALKENPIVLVGGFYYPNGVEFQNFDFTKYKSIGFTSTNMHSNNGYNDRLAIYINDVNVFEQSSSSSLTGVLDVSKYGPKCSFRITGANANGYTQNIKFQITSVN